MPTWMRRLMSVVGGKRPQRGHRGMSAYDAVDGAHSAASKCHRVVALKRNVKLRRGRTGTSRVMMVWCAPVGPGMGRTRYWVKHSWVRA